jgi:hypothetical protein
MLLRVPAMEFAASDGRDAGGEIGHEAADHFLNRNARSRVPIHRRSRAIAGILGS